MIRGVIKGETRREPRRCADALQQQAGRRQVGAESERSDGKETRQHRRHGRPAMQCRVRKVDRADGADKDGDRAHLGGIAEQDASLADPARRVVRGKRHKEANHYLGKGDRGL